jgi:phosphatidyl-myo-inositol dimannoside synthase
VSRHLLVTNDFPPKVGGIQSYLWELWQRFDPDSFVVLTATSHEDQESFDAECAARGVRIERVPERILYFPTPSIVRRIRALAEEIDATLVVLDPAVPLGLVGPNLHLPYAVVLHGAEVTVPARVPGSRQALAYALRRSSLIISAGRYPETQARAATGGFLPPVISIPPGVDTTFYSPLDDADRCAARIRLGLDPHGLLVSSVSRLVPRKGMDVLVEAVERISPGFADLTLAIAGTGRDAERLERAAHRANASVVLMGRVSEKDKALLLGASDVFVMACRGNRWFGLEQEGFGIVFLEAAATGVPQIAGESGGAAEAVEHGVTGLVVEDPGDPGAVAIALRRLLNDEALRKKMGSAARVRAKSFDYELLAPRLAQVLTAVGG